MLYFDIGANIGNWSIANIKNSNQIIAVEASPTTFKKLLDNITDNTINLYDNKKIVCINFAVCNNNNEDIVFYENQSDTISSLNKEWFDNNGSRFYGTKYKEIICKTITLDNLINIYGLPELIKIDVEAGEYECISSLTKKVNNLCFEWASEFNNISLKCIDYLTSIGFTKFYLQFEDDYTYRPEEKDYVNNIIIKQQLNNTIPKKDWGMIWCK
jgi:FkbM family methyltransferase